MTTYQPVPGDARSISETIARAFHEYPSFRHTVPDAKGRQHKLEVLFSVIARYAFRKGNVIATSDRLEGVLLHLPWNQKGISAWDMVRSGAAAIIKHLGWKFIMVQRAIDVLVDDLHAAVAPMDHEYLWVLAVDPPFQGRGLSRVLVERLLATLEHGTRRPCYLETMDPRNVAIYQKFGFEVAGTRASKELELTITGMLCKP